MQNTDTPQSLLRETLGLGMCIKKDNTPEFMEYYEQKPNGLIDRTNALPGMKSRGEIRVRLTETIGEIRRMDGKSELMGFQSAEEWEVYDSLVAERDILQWVLS